MKKNNVLIFKQQCCAQCHISQVNSYFFAVKKKLIWIFPPFAKSTMLDWMLLIKFSQENSRHKGHRKSSTATAHASQRIIIKFSSSDQQWSDKIEKGHLWDASCALDTFKYAFMSGIHIFVTHTLWFAYFTVSRTRAARVISIFPLLSEIRLEITRVCFHSFLPCEWGGHAIEMWHEEEKKSPRDNGNNNFVPFLCVNFELLFSISCWRWKVKGSCVQVFLIFSLLPF